ncbi:hypothetical protein I7H67_02990 [Acinetobacter sp. ACIN00229]|uniref:hypothetical protein n=1 Tax=Acinetobacter sp. ACIN00229 TaxID=2792607 RepID=UPI0018DF167A|nr:hypothetical protein [Acinetobacter sp. ACIN00229]MBI0421772.1 hypothetical protein [Acinetobacter sp. ACIN00229]
MKLLSFILSLTFASNCFALSSEEFEKKYQQLTNDLVKAINNNAADSRDYNDDKIPESEKIQSMSSWCKLAKTRTNQLDFVINNFSDYKELMKRNNIQADAKLEDIKKFRNSQKALYLRIKDQLKDTSYPCD